MIKAMSATAHANTDARATTPVSATSTASVAKVSDAARSSALWGDGSEPVMEVFLFPPLVQ